jgi:hypothetical protein
MDDPDYLATQPRLLVAYPRFACPRPRDGQVEVYNILCIYIIYIIYIYYIIYIHMYIYILYSIHIHSVYIYIYIIHVCIYIY